MISHSDDSGDLEVGKSTDTTNDAEQWETAQVILRYVLVAILLGLIIYFIIDSETDQNTEKMLIREGKSYLKLDTLSFAIVFFMVTVALTIVNVPMTILAVVGGLIFAKKFELWPGILYGFIVNLTGFTCGAMCCFGLSVLCFRDKEYISSHEYLHGMDRALKGNGLLLNILLRVTPILPASVVNYSLPAMGSNLMDFSLGCLIGSFPYTLLMTLIGAFLSDAHSSPIAKDLQNMPVWADVVFTLFGVSLLVAIVWIILQYLLTELNELKNERGEEGRGRREERNFNDESSVSARNGMNKHEEHRCCCWGQSVEPYTSVDASSSCREEPDQNDEVNEKTSLLREREERDGGKKGREKNSSYSSLMAEAEVENPSSSDVHLSLGLNIGSSDRPVTNTLKLDPLYTNDNSTNVFARSPSDPSSKF